MGQQGGECGGDCDGDCGNTSYWSYADQAVLVASRVFRYEVTLHMCFAISRLVWSGLLFVGMDRFVLFSGS